MGKGPGDSPYSAGGGGGVGDGSLEVPGEGARGRLRWWRCAVAVLLGAAVMLSAMFWLPPFARRREGLREDRWCGAHVVLSFRLQRMLSELNENKAKLEYDIFEEIGIGNSTVSVISFDPIAESNWTTVIFGIWAYPSTSTISPTVLSILRSSLVSLVIQQSTLHLTPSLFGNSSSFEILRFPGGITIIPPQNAFVPQKPDGLFNFSLNFPINVVQDKVGELKVQMKSGLFLNNLEILYVTLTNLDGSTVAPPTVVQTSVLLAVGAVNKPPSSQRLKQLAQTLRNSSSGNLGLNHKLFGRVKQISLSSYLQHSLNNAGHAHSPSPAPQPYNQPHSTYKDNNHNHQHHHHSHHHHHHHDFGYQGLQHLTPTPAPTHSTPTTVSCDSSCAHKKSRNNAEHHSAPVRSIAPVASPSSYEASGPYLDPSSFHPKIPSSPLPAVVFHAMAPSESVETSKTDNKFSSISPAPSTCELFFLTDS